MTYVFDDSSLLLLESAMTAFDRMRAAQELIKTHGLTYVDAKGNQKACPAVAIERDSKATLLRFWRQLGIDLEVLHDGPGRPAGT